MLNAWGTEGPDFYPEPLRPEIDDINALVYDGVNNAVYQAGFASSQAAYEEAFDRLFATLDRLEERLAGRRYLFGDRSQEDTSELQSRQYLPCPLLADKTQTPPPPEPSFPAQ